jgi:hypothetical protein
MTFPGLDSYPGPGPAAWEARTLEKSNPGSLLTLIRMTKDEKVLAIFKGLLL